jgi:Uma2 family endonuclease
MHRLAEQTVLQSAGTAAVEPLENGDHLTAEEFLERYSAMPDLKKAELIEGRVYVAPPVSHAEDSKPHLQMAGLLSLYIASTPGVDGGDNGTVRFDAENILQPDLTLLIKPGCGGQTLLQADNIVTGAPELVVEIAASSVGTDLFEKKALYARCGTREYVVWQTRNGKIDHWILRGKEFAPLVASDGIFQSENFPGLWIDADALVTGDLAKALKTVQQGIASPEHATFISLLQQRAASASKP